MALAAKRQAASRLEREAAEGGGEGGGEGRGVSRSAAAEVEALLEQNKAQAAQVRVLQNKLAGAQTELSGFRAKIAFAAVLLLLGTGLAQSEWWEESLTEAAANTFLHAQLR